MFSARAVNREVQVQDAPLFSVMRRLDDVRGDMFVDTESGRGFVVDKIDPEVSTRRLWLAYIGRQGKNSHVWKQNTRHNS